MTQAALPAMGTRARQGQLAYQRGMAAETNVCRHYEAAGHQLRHRRWRGKAGEVDLIFAEGRGDGIIFIEVKAASTHETAAQSLHARQMMRLSVAASEYCARLPLGQLTPMRFDVALVDQHGRVEILPNAFGAS